jgi:inhibitor of cysteine peptidase
MLMKRNLKFIAMVLFISAVVFDIGSAEKIATPGNETMGNDQIVTGNDSGKIISLKNGENFTLILREKPSTGYVWEINLSKGLSILSDKFTQDTAPPGTVGVSGNHSWIIQPLAPGIQQVNGIHKRLWENTTGTEESFTFTVEVI